MADPLSEVARQLTAMVDLGRVDDAATVEALAEQASWRGGYLRETASQDFLHDPPVAGRLDDPDRQGLSPLPGQASTPTARSGWT